MLSMRYGDELVPDFEPLVRLLPPAPLRPLRVQRCPWSTFGGGQPQAATESTATRKSADAVNSRWHGAREVVIWRHEGGTLMAVVIDTPFPSVATVARIMGVSPKCVKEIQRMVDALPSADRRHVSKRRSRNGQNSARPRSGRRS